VPITYPGGGDTVTFVRGHEDEGREPKRIDWNALAKLEGTVVSYAGPQQLPKMLNALIDHGRSPEEPAAIILRGTLPSQQTIAGTLGELRDRMKQDAVGAGLLIVGKVVNFREHLRWFDSRPLFGRQALVMHSKEQPEELADLLRSHGAEVIVDTDTDADVYRLLLDRRIDLVTFTSASAVLNFAANFGAEQVADLLAHTIVAVQGAAAADAATRASITPVVQAPAGPLPAFADAIVAKFRGN
jgi:uroporphyrinogen III methyltransferase/synthase